MQISDSTARTADISELANIELREKALFTAILSFTRKRGQQILELAQLIERKYELGAFTLPVSEISTHLGRRFREAGEKSLAHNINWYLPEKYKNQNQMRFSKLETSIEEMNNKVQEMGNNRHTTESRTESQYDRIEDYSNTQIVSYYETRIEFDNVLDDYIRVNNNEIGKVEQIAFERGLELGGFKYRMPISAHDDHWNIPESMEDRKKGVLEHLDDIIDAYKDIRALYDEWPPTDPEELKRHYFTTLTYSQILRPHHDLKWSGSWGFWFNRGYLEDTVSKRAAGNSDKFPTLYCTYCSKNIENDPTDYHMMQKDSTSETEYRCLKCKGTKYMRRAITREQVGDRRDKIFTFANHVLEYFPMYPDFLNDIHKNYWKKNVDGRKTRIAPQFSNSAIGGTDTKVLPRHSNNTNSNTISGNTIMPNE